LPVNGGQKPNSDSRIEHARWLEATEDKNMADPRKRLKTNVDGDFFVDSTCINCDTCRQLAPTVFGELDGYSCVRNQPQAAVEAREATRALLACPTGSIGTARSDLIKQVQSDFPLVLESNVFYCGYNSPHSYGGNSYFIQDTGGNWLVDSPKFLPQLVSKFHEMGGIKYIFLTHRDDVADAAKYAKEFGSIRIIHKDDLSAAPQAEMIVEGTDDVRVSEQFIVIPTPGHTKGHCVLLYRDHFLFTGDHLDWDRDDERLSCFPDYCWYSWAEQKKSIAKLTHYNFEWVLPGHGQRIRLPAKEMQSKLNDLVDRIEHLEE
jgi:glyoxylase-like metal-dependent hydrolase (beta-lactamase superfamily II)/ferredoxin